MSVKFGYHSAAQMDPVPIAKTVKTDHTSTEGQLERECAHTQIV